MAVPILAQGQSDKLTVQSPESFPLAEIPFELYHNRIYLPVRINNAGPFSVVVDTGASTSGISEAQARQMGVHESGKASLKGNGEGIGKIGLAKNVEFNLDGLELDVKTAAVVPFEQLESFEGRRIAGILGAELFKDYVVVIDYREKVLSLYDPSVYEYSGHGDVLPLHILKGGTLALIQAKVSVSGKAPVDARLALDMGTYSALRLYRPFDEKQGLPASGQKVLPSFEFGLGGEFSVDLGRVQNLELGWGIKIPNPVTSFSQAGAGATAGGDYDGTVGGEILRRFKVILDYSRQQLILEKNVNLDDPYSADMSGLILTARGKSLDEFEIRHIIPGTPAAEAGLREHDLLLAIDGKPSAQRDLQQVRELFEHEGVHKLSIKRGDQEMQFEIHTHPLI
jgi:PDZ domain/Aspartyl protease